MIKNCDILRDFNRWGLSAGVYISKIHSRFLDKMFLLYKNYSKKSFKKSQNFIIAYVGSFASSCSFEELFFKISVTYGLLTF